MFKLLLTRPARGNKKPPLRSVFSSPAGGVRAIQGVPMKSILAICLITFSFLVDAKELDVSFHRQNTQVWCWAATIAMVGGYVTGHEAEDCEVLSKYDQALGGPGNCCGFSARCTRTGQSQEIANILGDIYGISGYHHVRPLSYSELVDEIDNNQPFIAALSTGFSGHVVVISGYFLPDRVIILDPMSDRHVVPYQQLLNNFQLGNWTETFTVNTKSSIKKASCRTEYVDESYTDYVLQQQQVQGNCQHCGCNAFGCSCLHPFDWYTQPVQVPIQRTRTVPRKICD